MEDNRLVTWREAADALGIRGTDRLQRKTIQQLLADKRLSGCVIGKRWKITLNSVQKIIEDAQSRRYDRKPSGGVNNAKQNDPAHATA